MRRAKAAPTRSGPLDNISDAAAAGFGFAGQFELVQQLATRRGGEVDETGQGFGAGLEGGRQVGGHHERIDGRLIRLGAGRR